MEKSKLTDILNVIEEYSKVYEKFELLQKETDSLLPKHGDQKTGIIGEFYIYKYLEGKDNLKYAAHGEPWDIEYTDETGGPF